MSSDTETRAIFVPDKVSADGEGAAGFHTAAQAEAYSQEEPQEEEAAPTQLSSLLQRRAAALAAKTIDLLVPSMGGVVVRYRRVDNAVTNKIRAQHSKAPAREREKLIAATILATACAGVGDTTDDGELVSIDPSDPEGEWPTFDTTLAALLGVPGAKSASEVAIALYVHDGPLMATSARLIEWSGYDTEGIEEAVQGN